MPVNRPLLLLLAFSLLAAACAQSHLPEVAEAAPVVEERAITPTPTPTPRTFTEEQIKRRREIQDRMLKGEYHHDGSLALDGIGDLESVPALIRVLKDKPPGPNGMMVCTSAHALMALNRITRTNAGTTAEEWQAWWDQNKPKE